MLARHHEPIVAIATAPGRGAVGIVRVSGRGLDSLVQALCGRPLVPRHATYLPLRDGAGEPLDHGLAIFFSAPNSYTGEDVLELQVHGGQVVLQLLLARCLEVAAQTHPATLAPVLPGLRMAQPGEFTERAFLNDKIDLAQAEAVADLIDASTEAAARSASRSLDGAFSREIHKLSEGLIQLRMLVEATLDFPDEEIDFLQQADAQGQLQGLRAQLDELVQQAGQGRLLRDGIRVVIAGQPNAGKSSLLNALAGAELAIVTPIPGTTRDKVQQTIQIEGVPIHIVDTAGLRDSADEIERIGIERTWLEIEAADVLLFLHDLTRRSDLHYQRGDEEILSRLRLHLKPGVAVMHVWNKADTAPTKQAAELNLSAKTGEGLSELRRRLLEQAGWHPAGEGIYTARERHIHALQQAGERLRLAAELLGAKTFALELLAEELRLAQQALKQITGEFTPDDLLGVIFSRFCIGK